MVSTSPVTSHFDNPLKQKSSHSFLQSSFVLRSLPPLFTEQLSACTIRCLIDPRHIDYVTIASINYREEFQNG